MLYLKWLIKWWWWWQWWNICCRIQYKRLSLRMLSTSTLCVTWWCLKSKDLVGATLFFPEPYLFLHERLVHRVLYPLDDDLSQDFSWNWLEGNSPLDAATTKGAWLWDPQNYFQVCVKYLFFSIFSVIQASLQGNMVSCKDTQMFQFYQ